MCSSCQLLQIIVVVLEGQNELVPAGQLPGDPDGDQLSQPNDILDLLLLQLQIGKEHPMVELVLKRHRQPLALLHKHHIVNRPPTRRKLIPLLLARPVAHLSKHWLVRSVPHCISQLVEVVRISQQLIPLRVEVTQSVDILSSFSLSAPSITQPLDVERVVNNLNCHAVTLKFQQVIHHLLASVWQIGHAEPMELHYPYFLQ